ncbi:hypothetical protein ACW0Q9_00935, partial [Micromonospora sp. I033]
MSGFFARMAQRATGREPLVRLRAPQPFEAAFPDLPADVPVEAPASWPEPAAPTPPPSRAIPDRPAARSVAAAGRTGPVPAPVASDQSRSDRTRVDRTPPAMPPEAAPAVPD